MFRLVLIVVAAVGLEAATLERLSMNEMIMQSSDIVRARVASSRSAFRGPGGRDGMVYTWYTLQIEERWKGGPAKQMEVAVPGGAIQGLTQTIPGAPVLQAGDEYVFFVWTSRSGLAQIIGLVQGLFEIRPDAAGRKSVIRQATAESMLDPVTRRPVVDRGAKYGYQELKNLVLTTLAAGGAER
jgi:hypothetical protein